MVRSPMRNVDEMLRGWWKLAQPLLAIQMHSVPIASMGQNRETQKALEGAFRAGWEAAAAEIAGQPAAWEDARGKG